MFNLTNNDLKIKEDIYKEFGIILKISKVKEIKMFLKKYGEKIAIDLISDNYEKNKNEIEKLFEFKETKGINLEPRILKENFIKKYKKEIEKYINQEKFQEKRNLIEKRKEEIIKEIIENKTNQIFNINNKKNKYKIYYKFIDKEDIINQIDIKEKVIKNIREKLSVYIEKEIYNVIDYRNFISIKIEKDKTVIKYKLNEQYIEINFKENKIKYALKESEKKEILFKKGEKLELGEETEKEYLIYNKRLIGVYNKLKNIIIEINNIDKYDEEYIVNILLENIK